MATPQRGNAPVAVDEAVARGYVDGIALGLNQMGLTPPPGWFLAAQSSLGSGAGTLVRGRWTATPFRVTSPGFTADALAMTITTAVVAGTGVHLAVGLYKDDGTGFPDTVSAPVMVTDFTTLTPTGTKINTVTPVVLAPGLYWVVSLYDYTTAPTTGLATQCYNNTAWQLPNPSGAITASRAYVNGTTRTALPTVSLLSGLSISGSSDAPTIQIRRAA